MLQSEVGRWRVEEERNGKGRERGKNDLVFPEKLKQSGSCEKLKHEEVREKREEGLNEEEGTVPQKRTKFGSEIVMMLTIAQYTHLFQFFSLCF